ncbi:amidohydrolase [Emcibacter sp.]|uniref:amidohydrolase n=1 Tax=Emcibacter sp. TaxID=1979954 RepID=UPI002AA770D5|nr:amidohydrolase [Emcibacter sp.]
MKSVAVLLSGLCLSALTLPALACEKADLVLHNATIYTVHDKAPKAEAVAIKDGKFIYVGNEDGIKPYLCGDNQIRDLHGMAVYPGFTDSHYHLKGVGYREKELNLQGSESLKAMLQQVSAYQQAHPAPARDWLVGRGWIEKTWPEKRFPTLREIDAIVPDRPAFLVRADGHAGIANSRALELAGIDAETQAPDGGAILKDPDGKPSGMLVDNAMVMVTRLIPEPSRADDKDAFVLATNRNASLGWTQIQNAGGIWQDLELLDELRQEGKLKTRVYYALSEGEPAKRLLAEGPVIDPGHMIVAHAIKLYSDGALGSRGAALLADYSDHHSKGLLLTDHDRIMPILIQALKKGIQIETHAIGDRANRLVLDWYEEAFSKVPPEQRKIKEPRWRIEHAQNIHPDDQQRFVDLGVIPSMQASHAIGDLHFAPDRLGPERLKYAYPWKDMIKKGAIIPGGSDAPVEIGDPRIEFYAAVIRKDLNGYQAEGWHPEQALSRVEALKMLTIWPAIAAFQEDVRGSIEVGKLADLTVLTKDLMTEPEENLMSSSTVMTIVAGTIVFEK